MKDKAVVIHTPPRSTISRSSSNASYNRSGSTGSGNNGGSSSTPLNTRYLFLKIGLAASVAFHFTWVATQLSSLGTHMNVDELLIAPEYTKEHDHRRDLYASSSSSSGAGTYRRNSIRNKHPFDPRGKSLPKHPFPNAELQELVSSHLKYDCPEGLIYVADHILVSFSLLCRCFYFAQSLFLASNYFVCNQYTPENMHIQYAHTIQSLTI